MCGPSGRDANRRCLVCAAETAPQRRPHYLPGRRRGRPCWQLRAQHAIQPCGAISIQRPGKLTATPSSMASQTVWGSCRGTIELAPPCGSVSTDCPYTTSRRSPRQRWKARRPGLVRQKNIAGWRLSAVVPPGSSLLPHNRPWGAARPGLQAGCANVSARQSPIAPAVFLEDVPKRRGLRFPPAQKPAGCRPGASEAAVKIAASAIATTDH